MSKNLIQFQEGYSLQQLFKEYGTEEQCEKVVFQWKWPTGFSCPACQKSSYCVLEKRHLYQCNRCHHQTSLTSGTLFESTKLPLTTWFLAIYLITQSKTGKSALSLKRDIGVSYNTAWSMKHKIMQAMKERDDKEPLTGTIQLDDVYWGGERHGGKSGRGAENKTPFLAAVSVNDEGHPQRMNLNVVEGFTTAEVERWAKKHLASGSQVISDGLACFGGVKAAGCHHTAIVTGGGFSSVQLKEFKWVNMMIGNVKNAIKGTYHAINKKHLPRYLAEFCYRFNRRFHLENILVRFMFIALRTTPMPNRLLKIAEHYG